MSISEKGILNRSCRFVCISRKNMRNLCSSIEFLLVVTLLHIHVYDKLNNVTINRHNDRFSILLQGIYTHTRNTGRRQEAKQWSHNFFMLFHFFETRHTKTHKHTLAVVVVSIFYYYYYD